MPNTVTRLGIVGAGTMGAGIAQVAVQAGCQVWLLDTAPAAVELAVDRVGRGLGRLVARGTLAEDARVAALERLQPTSDLVAVAQAEIVVEAVVEREGP